MVDFKRNGKSVSVEPTLLKISDELSLLYGKSANSRLSSSSTQSAPSSSISKRWRRESPKVPQTLTCATSTLKSVGL